MNDNNLHRIFADTECISYETLQDYLNNKLSESERNKVEVHLASCEMCNDEFEGMSLLKNPATLPEIVFDLNKKIDDKLKPKRKTITLFKPAYKIAAAVVLLIVSGWFIKLYVDAGKSNESMISQSIEESAPKEILSEHHANEEETTLLDKTEEIKIVDKTTPETIENEKINFSAEGDIRKDIIEIEKEPELITEEEADLVVTRSALGEVNEVVDEKSYGATREIKLKEEIKLASDDIAEELELEDIEVYNKEDRQKKKIEKNVVVQTNTVAIDNFDLAMAEYNKRDYKEALILFKKSLNTYNNKDEVHFYLANSYWKLEDTGNAIINFNKVIAMAQSPYYEEALWNKSQILSTQNKEKELINTLNKVKEYKGSYLKKANKMLDSIQGE